uniref:Uncharacterized protein n=1 Tax=Octopus bimaculoides TaxID=37653 RepID=A0A0L8FU96_OCTBM
MYVCKYVCVVSYSSKVLRDHLNRLKMVENILQNDIQHSDKKKDLISTEFQDQIAN